MQRQAYGVDETVGRKPADAKLADYVFGYSANMTSRRLWEAGANFTVVLPPASARQRRHPHLGQVW